MFICGLAKLVKLFIDLMVKKIRAYTFKLLFETGRSKCQIVLKKTKKGILSLSDC